MIDELLTERVIGAFHRVYNVMGPGLPESVYVGALFHECRKRGLDIQREYAIEAWYDDVVVGRFRVDLFVERRLVLEVKSCQHHNDHYLQLLTYLRIGRLPLGLLLYFVNKPDVRRVRHAGLPDGS